MISTGTRTCGKLSRTSIFLHRTALQRLLADAFGPEHLHLGCRVERQVQLMSWAASDALHLPDGPAARRRNAGLPRLADRLAWIHAYHAFALA